MKNKVKKAKKINRHAGRARILVLVWAALLTIAVVFVLFREVWPLMVVIFNEILTSAWHLRLALSELAIEAKILKMHSDEG